MIMSRGWIAIPQRSSLTTFRLHNPLVGQNRTHATLCDDTVESTITAAKSPPYDNTYTRFPRDL